MEKMARKLPTTNLDEEERFLVRIAWACEVEGITQADAAKRFGVTRLKVNKALSEARTRGIVRVSINSTYGPCVELEEVLKERFKLDDVHVIPTPDSEDLIQMIVGAALGHYLSYYLADPKIKLFGMSWGNTLNMATRYMTPIDRPDLEIVSVMGGVTRGSDLNSYEITRRLADLCNANHFYFTAPIYAGSKESRDILIRQDVFAEVISKIRSADAIALAVGALERSLLMRDGLPSQYNVETLRMSGAVGDVLGYILNREGELIDHPINDLQLGIELDDLKRIPNVILAAGGLYKKDIISAILNLNVVNTLVIDEQTARTLP